jgi:hypothetical protein
MSGKFQPINRDAAYLLPPSLQDWLPEKHLARFVVDIVDQLDLNELVKCYGGGGNPSHRRTEPAIGGTSMSGMIWLSGARSLRSHNIIFVSSF